MSEITISTSNLKTTRQARIDGALYEVRQIGAGDRLDISLLAGKLVAESRKSMNLKGKGDALKDADDEEQNKILDEISVAFEAVAKAQTDLENCYVKLFTPLDDKGDAVKLVHDIGVDGVKSVLEQIFKENPKAVSDGTSD